MEVRRDNNGSVSTDLGGLVDVLERLHDARCARTSDDREFTVDLVDDNLEDAASFVG